MPTSCISGSWQQRAEIQDLQNHKIWQSKHIRRVAKRENHAGMSCSLHNSLLGFTHTCIRFGIVHVKHQYMHQHAIILGGVFEGELFTWLVIQHNIDLKNLKIIIMEVHSVPHTVQSAAGQWETSMDHYSHLMNLNDLQSGLPNVRLHPGIRYLNLTWNRNVLGINAQEGLEYSRRGLWRGLCAIVHLNNQRLWESTCSTEMAHKHSERQNLRYRIA